MMRVLTFLVQTSSVTSQFQPQKKMVSQFSESKDSPQLAQITSVFSVRRKWHPLTRMVSKLISLSFHGEFALSLQENFQLVQTTLLICRRFQLARTFTMYMPMTSHASLAVPNSKSVGLRQQVSLRRLFGETST